MRRQVRLYLLRGVNGRLPRSRVANKRNSLDGNGGIGIASGARASAALQRTKYNNQPFLSYRLTTQFSLVLCQELLHVVSLAIQLVQKY